MDWWGLIIWGSTHLCLGTLISCVNLTATKYYLRRGHTIQCTSSMIYKLRKSRSKKRKKIKNAFSNYKKSENIAWLTETQKASNVNRARRPRQSGRENRRASWLPFITNHTHVNIVWYTTRVHSNWRKTNHFSLPHDSHLQMYRIHQPVTLNPENSL